MSPGGRRAVAIGNFDGVHRGHARLIAACVDAARRTGSVATVLTFEPHPASVVSPAGAPPRIQTRPSQERRLRDLGVEEIVRQKFDEDVARMSPVEFVDHILVGRLQAAVVIVGVDFRFGSGRSGGVLDLKALAAERFEVLALPPVEDEQGPISSSRVRAGLRRGDLAEAERLLGAPYEIEGLVLHGDARGRDLGYPTANVDLQDVTALAPGIYGADAILPDDRRVVRAAVSLGTRPTFDGRDLRLEAHLLDFEGDLYGKNLRLIFLQRLRDELKFDSVDALLERMRTDVAAARALRSPGSPRTG